MLQHVIPTQYCVGFAKIRNPVNECETGFLAPQLFKTYAVLNSDQPGTILADELAELHLSPAELARKRQVPSNRIYQLIAGKRAMTAYTALRYDSTFYSA